MKTLVTGGGGFLGRHIVERLVARGDRVRSLGRRRRPEIEALGAESVAVDLTDAAGVVEACAGVDTVFHCAAIAGVWGRREDYRSVNVVGASHVLGGCLRHGVRRLVFTSSPSVIWRPDDLLGANEDEPYAERHICPYAESKAEAEKLVLTANGTKDLKTIALRPHLMWGPGDNHLVPRIVDLARRGRLRRVGAGRNLVDLVYVENAADAHVLAADRLAEGAPVDGRAYFIAQDEPVNLWEWINRLLERLEIAPVRRSISYGAARALGAVSEALYRGLRREGDPPMTRFVAHQLARSHYFDDSRARQELGYAPRVGMEEGMERLVESLKGN